MPHETKIERELIFSQAIFDTASFIIGIMLGIILGFHMAVFYFLFP